VTVHEYIIPHVLIFRQHNGDDPPQDIRITEQKLTTKKSPNAWLTGLTKPLWTLGSRPAESTCNV